MNEYDLTDGHRMRQKLRGVTPAPARPTYTAIHLDDDVPVGLLVRALTRFGLTLSNVSGVGLVIHKAEDLTTPRSPDAHL